LQEKLTTETLTNIARKFNYHTHNIQ
jgi:hypothetical protein